MRNITIDISDFQIFKELSLQSMFIPVVFPSTSMPSNMKNRSNIGSVVALAQGALLQPTNPVQQV